MVPPSDPVRNGTSNSQEITTLVCDERGECVSTQDAALSELPLSSSSLVSEASTSNYSENPTEACYSQPLSLSRAPTSVWHSFASTSPREQAAARALGRALEGWIRDMDRNHEEVDPRLRGLASVLRQGYLPTVEDIESNPMFNQSYKDGSLDVLIQSIASRVPNTDQVHRTALALSLPYNLQHLSPETRSDVIAALATDSQTRTVLAQAAPNSIPSVQTEIARTLASTVAPAPVASSVGAANGASAAVGASGGLAAVSRDDVLRASAQVAVRSLAMSNPPAGLLIEGARMILPQLVEDPSGLPPFVESLLWSPSSSGILPGSPNPMPNVLPILMKDLPGVRSSRETLSEEASAAEAGAAAAAGAMAGREAALGRAASRDVNSSSPSPSQPAPAPGFFDRVQDLVTHPTPTQSLLIGIGSSILFPTLSAAAALQSSGLISQAGFSQGFAPGAGAVLTYAVVKPVSSSAGAQSDSDGSGHSQSGNGQSGGNSQGGQNPRDEHPHRDDSQQA